ncbi:MAG: Gfo/Idh/MocA family oxidoreductase [Anaerolineae bacterium]|nr:Gfo/Idh/MocA family oxidoreductase [Candidatus Roseilinea sp.]MDW8449421.1 Gfo/Idh/MocA family oxidoreductase [Anaerolineae bacterium]
MAHSLRYAIVGAGAGIAELHLRALAQLPAARIVGMADLNPERGRPRAAAAGCPFFTDHCAMIEATQPDVVVICTPHPSHPQIALDAFARGAHVLVEKPMAIQVADADRMIAAADAAGRLLAVNFQQRFRPVVERAIRFIAEGELGELMRAQVSESWYRTAAYYKQAPWRGTWRGEGGAILMNQATHTLDLLCHLAGLPAKVWGWTKTRIHAIECEDTAQAMLEFSNGAPGYFTASTAEAIGGPRQRILIVGERGVIEIADAQITLTRFARDVREFAAHGPGPYAAPEFTQDVLELPGDGGGHLAVYRDLEAAIAEGRQPRVNGCEARMSLELANAITYSAHTGRPVTLPLDCDAYAALLAHLQSGAGRDEQPIPTSDSLSISPGSRES